MNELIEALAGLSEDERLELCDALLDRPELRDLLDTLDDYLYFDAEETPADDAPRIRELN